MSILGKARVRVRFFEDKGLGYEYCLNKLDKYVKLSSDILSLITLAKKFKTYNIW